MSDTEQEPAAEPIEEPKKSRVELRRTPAEMLADSILRQQRIKGRKTYGRGLNHEDDYRWHMEAAQEFADGFQYVCAENMRLHDEVVRLTAELDSLRKATLDTAPFIPAPPFKSTDDLPSQYALAYHRTQRQRDEWCVAAMHDPSGRRGLWWRVDGESGAVVFHFGPDYAGDGPGWGMLSALDTVHLRLDAPTRDRLVEFLERMPDAYPIWDEIMRLERHVIPPMSEEEVRRSFNEHLAQHAKMAAEQGADDSQERHHRAANSYLTPFIPPMDPPLPPVAVALLEAVGLAPPAEAP